MDDCQEKCCCRIGFMIFSKHAFPPKKLRVLIGLAGLLAVSIIVSACQPVFQNRSTAKFASDTSATPDPHRFQWQTETPKVIELQVTRLPTPSPTPEVEILASGWRMVKEGQVRVFGIFRNNRRQPIDFTLIRVDLLDHQGGLVATQEAYPILDVTFAGEVNGFAVDLAADEGSWATIQMDLVPQDYYGDYIQNGISVLSAIVERSGTDETVVVARIKNDSGLVVEKAQVLIAVYDDRRNLLDVLAGTSERGYWSAREVSDTRIELPAEIAAAAVSAQAWAQGYKP